MAALRSELSNPLYRNAYALIVNGGLTGVLGLAYWFLAARLYSPADVGRNAAELQAMMFIGGLTALNYMLIRFIPQAGDRTGTLVLRTYAAGAGAAAVLGTGFLFTLPLWGPTFSRLDGLTAGLWFVAAAVAWNVFTQQDGVFTGLRQAAWVPLENTAFGLVKLVLLVALATSLPHAGIAVSWSLPVLVSLIPINVFILRRLVPEHMRVTEGRFLPPTVTQIGRYLAGDYVGGLFSHASINLIPVIVAARVTPDMNAYFGTVWAVGMMLDLLAANMAMSLTVEGAFDASKVAETCRAALNRTVKLLVPLIVLVVVGAHFGLRMFGARYAAHGTTLLIVLALSALPKAVIELYLGVLRVQSRTRPIALLQAARFIGVLVLVIALTGRLGVTGPGIAVLVVSTAAAVAVLPALRRVAQIAVRPRGYLRIRRFLPAGLCFGAGLALFWIPLTGVHLGAMNGFGLISVLPITTIAGAVLLVLAFILTLALRRPHPVLLAGQLVVILVSLHGLGLFLEPYARFPTSWQHAGFIEYIARTHTVDPRMDARFSWPGFFALIAFVTRAVGVHNMEPVLHWAPLVTQLLYLGPMFLILRVMRTNWRAKWMAAWLFVVADWVGQDYLSPQAFGYLLYLLFIGILLTWFRAEPRPGKWVARTGRVRVFVLGPLASGERPTATVRTQDRVVLIALLVVLAAVGSASHQLTPFLIMFVCAGLVLVRRCTLRGFPVLLGVIAASWVSFMASGYWSGHLSDIFGGVGQLGSNVSSSVAGRISNGSPQLAMVQEMRILIAVAVLGLALLGALRRRLRRLDDRVAIVLLCAPFLSLGLQNYGGEIALRVYLFMLPGAVILISYLFFPTTFHAVRARLALAGAALCCVAVLGGFLAVRFGNEAFEQVRPGDVKAYDAMLRQNTGGINVVWMTVGDTTAGGNPQQPWGYREMERFNYYAVDAPRDPTEVAPILTTMRARPYSYFVTSRINEAFLQYNFGLSPTYGDRMRGALSSSPDIRVVYQNKDAAVYALRSAVPGPPATVPSPPHFSLGKTPWTPVGLVAVPLLIGVLVVREIRRLRGLRLRYLTWAAIPLLLVVAAVIIERFSVLGS